MKTFRYEDMQMSQLIIIGQVYLGLIMQIVGLLCF